MKTTDTELRFWYPLSFLFDVHVENERNTNSVPHSSGQGGVFHSSGGEKTEADGQEIDGSE